MAGLVSTPSPAFRPAVPRPCTLPGTQTVEHRGNASASRIAFHGASAAGLLRWSMTVVSAARHSAPRALGEPRAFVSREHLNPRCLACASMGVRCGGQAGCPGAPRMWKAPVAGGGSPDGLACHPLSCAGRSDSRVCRRGQLWLERVTPLQSAPAQRCAHDASPPSRPSCASRKPRALDRCATQTSAPAGHTQ